MNKYKLFKDNQQKNINDFFKTCGFFAFNNEQFNKGMIKIGLNPEKDLKKVYRISSGGFILKSKASQYDKLFKDYDLELRKKIDEDRSGKGFIKDMFVYELDNHEYSYTHDLSETLEVLNLSLESIRKNKALFNGLTLAIKECG